MTLVVGSTAFSGMSLFWHLVSGIPPLPWTTVVGMSRRGGGGYWELGYGAGQSGHGKNCSAAPARKGSCRVGHHFEGLELHFTSPASPSMPRHSTPQQSVTTSEDSGQAGACEHVHLTVAFVIRYKYTASNLSFLLTSHLLDRSFSTSPPTTTKTMQPSFVPQSFLDLLQLAPASNQTPPRQPEQLLSPSS